MITRRRIPGVELGGTGTEVGAIPALRRLATDGAAATKRRQRKAARSAAHGRGRATGSGRRH